MKPQSTGQVIEWLVWSTLVEQSQGALHVFLPTHDLGVDAVVRRPDTDSAVAVQVKGRTGLNEGIYRIHVQADEAGPGAVLVAVLADLPALRLDATVLLVPMAALAGLAPLLRWGRRMAFSVEVPWPPGAVSHWQRFAVPLDELGERLCPAGPGEVAPPPAAPADQVELAVTGRMAELEVLRRCVADPRLATFRAAPDIEFEEILVRRLDDGGILGVQVKCVETSAERPAGLVRVGPTFRPSASACLVIFARTAHSGLGEVCAVIPALELPELARPIRGGRLELRFDPTGRIGDCAAHLLPVEGLADRLAELARRSPGGRR